MYLYTLSPTKIMTWNRWQQLSNVACTRRGEQQIPLSQPCFDMVLANVSLYGISGTNYLEH